MIKVSNSDLHAVIEMKGLGLRPQRYIQRTWGVRASMLRTWAVCKEQDEREQRKSGLRKQAGLSGPQALRMWSSEKPHLGEGIA